MAGAGSYLRFPSLRGERVAFAADDDVWLAPLDGGRAWRLTADHAPVRDVRISPDGASVAYLGQRDGVPEVYVVPADGGPSRRLTWWGDRFARVLGWTPDGRVAAASAVREPFRSRTWARAVPLDGAPAERLPFGPVTALVHAPEGAVVVGTGGARIDYAWWKRYRGGTAGRLWIDRDGSGKFEGLLPELDGQLVAPMWVDGRVAFLSDHEGHGNVYSVLPNGSDMRRHTDLDGFWARQASSDSGRVVYMSAGELWLLDDLDPASQPRPLEIAAGPPRAASTATPVPASKHLGDVVPDRTGRASLVEARGTVHWVTHRDGPVRGISAEPGVRARLPRLLPPGDEGDRPAAVWVSDADGEDGLEVAGPDGRRRRLLSGRLGRVLALEAAPDGTTVAVASHDGRLLLVDIATGEDRVLARTENDAVRDLRFSPDSRWLAWTHPGRDPLSQVRLARLADGLVLDATPMRFTDTDPVFTHDGRYLAFLSRRTFDPVYDAYVFDLSFPAATRPYLLPLAALTPSPFDPQVHGRPVVPAEKKGGDGSVPPAVAVDVEGLADRVVPVPVPSGRYSSLHAVTDGLVWLREPLRGETGEGLAGPGAEAPRADVERVDFVTGRTSVLAEGADAVAVSGDGTRLVLRDGESLRVVPADRPVAKDDADADARVDVDLARLRLTVEPAAEWRQMFDETGRLMRDHFWAPDMAGVDWDGVLARYRPLLDRVATRDDLSDVVWEVQGELGTSHAYERAPERPVEAARRLGQLGADIERDANGRWRVARVLPGESSAGQARSPLRAPGVGVRPGDVLVAVDGRAVDPVTGPGPLLVGAADTPVELLVESSDGGVGRGVVVVPLADEMPLRYQAWVHDRRAVVHAATQGRVGYLHVPDMVASGWAQLHRDLRTEVARSALVLDVRDNGGGHTSQLVVERLARRLVGWEMGRGWEPFTYPSHARRGPLVCVTDENAGSDGDIITAVVKLLGLGPVIGMRTWGGVVGIDGRFTLVDGTTVTQPRYAFWFDGSPLSAAETGWSVENHGVDPDVEVPVPPQEWAAGRDPQLDTAVRLVLDALEAQQVSRPPDVGTRPTRVPPPLPPRP